jgi:hypothetical protein
MTAEPSSRDQVVRPGKGWLSSRSTEEDDIYQAVIEAICSIDHFRTYALFPQDPAIIRLRVDSQLDLRKAIEMAVSASAASPTRLLARAILYLHHLPVSDRSVELQLPPDHPFSMDQTSCYIAVEDSFHLRKTLSSASLGSTVWAPKDDRVGFSPVFSKVAPLARSRPRASYGIC